jgi:ankyrin repeat protein
MQDIDGNTPVHFASGYGHKEIMSLLLAQKPNLKLKNNLGKTPIDIASSKKILSVIFKISFFIDIIDV